MNTKETKMCDINLEELPKIKSTMSECKCCGSELDTEYLVYEVLTDCKNSSEYAETLFSCDDKFENNSCDSCDNNIYFSGETLKELKEFVKSELDKKNIKTSTNYNILKNNKIYLSNSSI